MKRISLFVLFGLIMTLLVSCKPQLSSDTFEVKTIFNDNHQFIYEKKENEVTSEISYTLTVDGDFATIDTATDFEDGEYRSKSTFNRMTLKPASAYKGNSYALHPEKNWDIYATYNQFLDMEAVSEGKTEEMSLALPSSYLDNEAIIFTLAAIEQQEDLVINVAVIDAGEVVPYKITWLGEADVEVPYGTLSCFRIQMEYTGPVLGPKPILDLWYTNDENRYLVKYSNSKMELLLKEIN
ncbi:MAG: DUF3108 domain-containing protein [Clostridia bacterium]|nr:DUF3108 domain-containing protein [Clostridia bacterium]